jgi:hypothetical protein
MKKPLMIYQALLYITYTITEVRLKLIQKLLPRNVSRNVWQTVVL